MTVNQTGLAGSMAMSVPGGLGDLTVKCLARSGDRREQSFGNFFVGRVAQHLPLSVANGVQPGFFRRSDEVPAKLCNETTSTPLINDQLLRAHSDENLEQHIQTIVVGLTPCNASPCGMRQPGSYGKGRLYGIRR